MKALTLTLTAATILLCSNAAQAHSSKQYVASDTSFSTSVCMAVVQDKPLRLTKRLKEFHITRARANDIVKCNGIDLATFANQHRAHKSIAFLHLEKNANNSITALNVK